MPAPSNPVHVFRPLSVAGHRSMALGALLTVLWLFTGQSYAAAPKPCLKYAASTAPQMSLTLDDLLTQVERNYWSCINSDEVPNAKPDPKPAKHLRYRVGKRCKAYRSYDPSTHTILGYDGRRHTCR